MSQPEIALSCVASVYVRQMTFKKSGDVEIGHKHIFDHQTLVAKGSVTVEVDGNKKTFTAPHIVFIKKNAVHELTALEDETIVYCIHALRDGEDVCDIIDPDSIPFAARESEIFPKVKNLIHV
jgi:quercetin dioxygenase-like cupin family protein